VPAQTKASRGIRTGSALPNPILEDAFVYEIRVTKSIQISAPGSGCTRIARGCDSADIALACALAKTAVAPARLRKEEAAASAVQQEIRRQIGTT
jgi:hypothetical protein